MFDIWHVFAVNGMLDCILKGPQEKAFDSSTSKMNIKPHQISNIGSQFLGFHSIFHDVLIPETESTLARVQNKSKSRVL